MAEEDKWKRRRRFDDRFGEFFMDFDKVEEMMDKMMGGFFQDREMRPMRKPMVMGFSIKQGPNGKINVQEFGNIKSRDGKAIVSEKREPLVDVVKSEKDVVITAELPGVLEKEINVELKGKNTVIISVDSKETPYYKELELQETLNPKTKKVSFKNGILEISFEKKKSILARKGKSK